MKSRPSGTTSKLGTWAGSTKLLFQTLNFLTGNAPPLKRPVLIVLLLYALKQIATSRRTNQPGLLISSLFYYTEINFNKNKLNKIKNIKI
jgi:hypothetical protein